MLVGTYCLAEMFVKFFHMRLIPRCLLCIYVYQIQCCTWFKKKALSFILYLVFNNLFKMFVEPITSVLSYYLDGSENVTGLDLSDFPALADRNRREGSGNPTPLINPLAGRAPYGN